MRVAVVATAICLSIVGVAEAQSAKAAIKMSTNIPTQALGPALKAFAQERDLQVLYLSQTVRGVRTGGASGELTIDEALTQLLSGTGLVYRYLDDKAVTILPAGPETGPLPVPGDDSDGEGSASKEGKKSSSGGFHADQVDQGGNTAPSAVGTNASSLQDQGVKLEEIIVTAQKRNERLIDVPQSVTALSSEDLTKLGATQFRDFADTVPGLSFQTFGAGFTQVTLRGVTTGSDVGQAVAVYVDEVPYGSSTAYAQAGQTALDVGLFDLDRIEVLRGPQGTLYGASSMGGLLKYVTKRPDASVFTGEAQSGVSGTKDGGVSYNFAGAVNLPLVSEMLAVRASAYQSHDGGYIDNVTRRANDVNRSDIYGGRIDALLTPTDKLVFRLTGFLQNIARDGEASADYAFNGTPLFGRLNQGRPFAEPFHQQFRLVSGTLTYDMGIATLTSISSYQNAQTRIFYDVTPAFLFFANLLGSNPPYTAIGNPVDIGLHKFTQELRLAGPSNRAMEWLVGGFYTHEDTSNVQSLDLMKPSGGLAPNNLFTYTGPSNYEEGAVFADLTYHFTPQFDMTGGVRVAHDHQSFEQIGGGLFGSSSPLNHSSESVTTWLSNARYHFNEHTMGYVRFATGYRPGGPNFLANDPMTGRPIASSTFGSDHLKSYEGGIKFETEHARYSADLAGYYIDWTDIQVTATRGSFSVLTNIPGGAKIKGAEILLRARPAAGLSLSAAVAYQDARISEDDADLGATDGERLPAVPQVTATGSADYLWGARYQPSLGATIRYVSNRDAAFAEASGRPQYYLPAYSAVDLRAGGQFGPLITRLYVRNLFNQDGQISALFTQFQTARVAVLQPRTIGIELSTQF